MVDRARSPRAETLAGGWCWFDRVERIERGGRRETVCVSDVPDNVVHLLSQKRKTLAGLVMSHPNIMGIINVTPDSFSDGGQFSGAVQAVAAGQKMLAQGADILDIGGESTRPGALDVAINDEIERVEPVVAGLSEHGPVSIDTRKSAVAKAALAAGAAMVNDVSALTFDPDLANATADAGVPICLMHAQGAPETMQDDPHYEDVLLDVYDGLSSAVDRALAAGINRDQLIVDPGIGFGKTLQHNLLLLQGISIFHGLGHPILLGASRKRFSGSVTGQPDAGQRTAGSVAVAQAAVMQGVQIVRVHDIKETHEAIQMARAINEQV